MNGSKRLGVIGILVLIAVANFCFLSSLDGRNADDKSVDELVKALRTIRVEGPSFGGPHVGIGHNEITEAICNLDREAVTHLVTELKSGTYESCVYSVFCLRELKSIDAAQYVRRLKEELESGVRFGKEPHDHTLLVQIELYFDAVGEEQD